MKKITLLFFLVFLIISAGAQTQKRQLTFDDILKWERITETHISNNGEFIVYKQEPWKGDPTLKITTPKGKEITSIACGTNATITTDSKFLIYTLKTSADTLRSLKLKKTKKEDLPQDRLVIYNLLSQTSREIPAIKSSKTPQKWAGWIAYQTMEETKKNDKVFPLFIQNLATNETKKIPTVSSYVFAKEQEVLAFVSEGDSLFDAGVYVSNLSQGLETQILEGKGKIKQLTVSDDGEEVAFIADFSDEKETNYSLYLWAGSGEAKVIVDNQNSAIPENWEISENGQLSFSDNEQHLFFGTAPKKMPKDTTILEEEIPVLDVWRWNEERLQTVQLHERSKDLKKSYLAVYNFNSQKTVQLETEEFTAIRKIKNGDADQLLAYSNRPYAVQAMWEGSPRHNDFYLVDINTGKARLIKKDCRATPSVSPEGNYLFWYNAIDTTWNTYDITSGKEYKITTPQTIQIADELNDIPNPPDSYRYAGWLQNDEAFLVYDRYDLWRVSPTNSTQAIKITPNGRAEKNSYRLIRFNPERGKGIASDETVLLKAHNEITRADSYYAFDLQQPNKVKLLFSGNYSLNTPRKAKNKDVLVFTKENFTTYPNLIATNLKFKNQQKLSNTAPQQDEFLWGTGELISWQSLDGKEIEGMLFKPDNFDPTKKYPMIVNFYEKSSQRLFSYRMPENHRSTIDYHYYTSNGYVVFNPDVYYREGYPGESAFNCVMPGVNAVVAKGFIDKKRIAAQGHSWGGYQVAYLATRTNRFAAIESGAPVVNMFSAYGGIRWGSGRNRSFQYEHTQSRIGKSIWESPLRYIENSPLFTLDKVETPILIMHNDDDGAVPWYQGIEYFIGLRRLQKPCWLLNYNEADHWPLKVRDKHDFQIRLAQFFDHYLKDAPMPVWMKEGIPATKKGIELGYDLVE